MGLFSKLGWFFRQEKRAYFIGVSLLFIVSLLAAIVPMIIGTIIDGMTYGTLTREAMWQWILILLVIGFAQYIMRYFWRMSIFGTSAKLEMILRRRLFVHFTKMDALFFQEHRTGDLMAHATNDVTTVRMVAGGGILTLVDALSQGLMTIFMMFVAVDWRLALAAIVPLPLIAIIIRFNGKRVHYYFRQAQEAFSSMNDKVQESMSGMKVIKTFGEEERDIEDFKRMTTNVVEKNRLAHRFDSFFRPSIQTVMGFSTVISLFYGGYLVSQGEITVGLLVAFLNYVTRMGWPMVAIGNLFNILERGSVSYNRIESLLKTKSHIIEEKKPMEDSISGDIEFSIDSFTYPRDEQPTLTNVHFTLEQGKTLGVVGKTGAGKSTVFKLLLRDYDDYRGYIRFNHHNIERYSLNALLSNIGYVPQDNFLFSTTVRDNIRFAMPSATQQEVEVAARLTSVHEDIEGFSYGYDTLVGERGVALSGGQKQRISIARAMILNPELLILDDSLSAVDARTEEAILNAVKSYRANKSTIISAHRLSSVMHADEIIVIDNGTISERGTHDELINQNGWYKEMFDKQQLEAELREEGVK
ncbi:ABC transporter ATP-binding protein [Tuanshanicoccus lijuaniae]|uniref:ABC transporter ATP-binding protein n=1 Tax=Aerococcaceae bacterium zg-1292 TaxID=2774330 RepID=UPI001BD90D7C|nr:ATP-binding cassette domain-containing protein [Aerococcaceae bacterium zg-BR9]MBF6977808.1 ATP-binding cassette domain-containing protein [Aerococcaceae bacterium zg-BR22]MBS4455976.1 ATP-binding cassette domain-containing protein [Aerococcaceae bacterium zg-A91]MBS4457728.1 ATP-binding cassette domain-containing protein [Aerococcaceae bacterium zg-BR33]